MEGRISALAGRVGAGRAGCADEGAALDAGAAEAVRADGAVAGGVEGGEAADGGAGVVARAPLHDARAADEAEVHLRGGRGLTLPFASWERSAGARLHSMGESLQNFHGHLSELAIDETAWIPVSVSVLIKAEKKGAKMPLPKIVKVGNIEPASKFVCALVSKSVEEKAV